MRDREVLAIANSMGLYDRKMDFVEISPDELIEFAREIADRTTEEVVNKMRTMLEKL